MSRNDSSIGRTTRRGAFGIIASGFMGAQAFANTPALLKGAGDYRALSLINNRTGERLNSVYWVEGQYIPEAIAAFNYILRDWRAHKSTPMDPRVLDILAAAHNLLECSEPLEVVSGYRTKQTNDLLRRRSRGVAKNSYHVKGMAIDVTLKTRSVNQIARAGHTLGAGGIGMYSRSRFVHFDSGPVRSWGR